MYQCVILYGNENLPLLKPAGPFRIATELRLHGYSTLCIDLTAFSPGFDPRLKTFLKKAIGSNTIWVGISGTFLEQFFGLPNEPLKEKIAIVNNDPNLNQGVKDFVSFVQSLNPQTKLIMGGSKGWDLSQFGFVHFDGFVDQTIVEYTKWLQGSLDKIPLEFYNKRIHNKEWEQFASSQILYTNDDIVLPNETLSTETARGCIFKCKFCAYALNGKTKGEWIKRAEVFKDELIKNFELHGTTRYNFSDDTFNDSLDKIKFLHDQVFSKLPFQIQFSTFLRLDLLMRFPDSVEILKHSGLKSALFGIESLNWRSAKAIGKGVNPLELLSFLKEVKRNSWQNILTYSGFIFGLPYDTLETFDEFDEFMMSDKNPLDTWMIEPLLLHPEDSGWFKLEFSFLDKEYSSYGYEIVKNLDAQYDDRVTWKNSVTNLNYFICKYKSIELLKKAHLEHPRFKSTRGWLYSYLARWIPEEDLTHLPLRELYNKYNTDEYIDLLAPIRNLVEADKTQYRIKLYQTLTEKLL